MNKTLVAVLTLFVVLTILDVSPIEAKRRPVMSLTRLEPAMPTKGGDPQEITCPDGGTCSSNTTCCLLDDGTFGCCTKTLGNCCSDYYHCCDSGYVCDMANKKCLPAGNNMEDDVDKMGNI